MMQPIQKTIIIDAPVTTVWKTLTHPGLMKQWMGEPAMEIEIITDWKVGNPIIIRGFHHIKFENSGTILQFDPESVLAYDYISSISRLPDTPENHTLVEFVLTPLGSQTALKLTLSNFPTESIYKHVDFYWRATLEILKKLIETIVHC